LKRVLVVAWTDSLESGCHPHVVRVHIAVPPMELGYEPPGSGRRQKTGMVNQSTGNVADFIKFYLNKADRYLPFHKAEISIHPRRHTHTHSYRDVIYLVVPIT